MKYRVNISNLSFDIEVEKAEDLSETIANSLSSAIVAALPKDLVPGASPEISKSKYITLEEFDYDWEKAIQHTQNSDVSIIKLQKGKKYKIKEYSTQKLTKDLFIISEGDSELIFGIDNYDQWKPHPGVNQDRYVFDLGKWNSKVGIINTDLKSANTVAEVQPFYRGVFINSIEQGQSGFIAIINSETNMEFGLIYSGGQDESITVIQKDIKFKGVIWQELKAKNGGGLSLIMDNCYLEQWDPPTYFQKQISFSKNYATLLEGSFNQIENIFQGMGNSSNIIFCEGMTFLLPPKTFIENYHNRYNFDSLLQTNNDSSHYIHSIPQKGEKFLVSRSYSIDNEIIPDMIRNVINWEKLGITPSKNIVRSLQAGDVLKIDSIEYTIKVKDRVNGVAFNSEYRHNGQDSYYSEEFKLDKALPTNLPMVFEVEIIKSMGEALLDGKPRPGYIIFKYNKNWQTNVEVDHGIDYMLASNPFGVLSYNHEEISVWARKTIHKGFYRQSKSGVGKSKGYTLKECQGFQDQFHPRDTIKSEGQMDQKAIDFINYLENL